MTTQTSSLVLGGDRRSTVTGGDRRPTAARRAPHSALRTPHSALRTPNGFSLVELLVVMAIIVILMGIALGVAGSAQRGAAENRARAEMANIALELDLYRADQGVYPGGNNLRGLVTWYRDRYEGTQWDLTDLSGDDPIDPWGNAYRYNPSNNRNFFTLWSRGPTNDSADEVHFNR